MKILLILFCMGVAVCGTAQTVKLSNPASVFTPKGYSHVAEVDLGNSRMLLLSGQVVRLFREDVLIEVEATAIVPRKR